MLFNQLYLYYFVLLGLMGAKIGKTWNTLTSQIFKVYK